VTEQITELKKDLKDIAEDIDSSESSLAAAISKLEALLGPKNAPKARELPPDAPTILKVDPVDQPLPLDDAPPPAPSEAAPEQPLADTLTGEKKDFDASERANWEKLNKGYDTVKATVETMEHVMDNAGDIVRVRVTTKGGSITRTVT
jgi:hypothetical protein